ncbi:LINE-1 reverse transcriptase like, partial [Trifolium medium]|nr:LINE-1 reverse transcriptase like [Trifolium medium]
MPSKELPFLFCYFDSKGEFSDLFNQLGAFISLLQRCWLRDLQRWNLRKPMIRLIGDSLNICSKGVVFAKKWIGWMRVCVFAGNLSVLVNGSTTPEINIQRGLKQGDPLAPFLFLLVVEGFSGVMRKVVDLNLFKGFTIGEEPILISHLQYADDTLCIGEASVGNLWTLKAILRGFELASGLKVNFWKSGLCGANVSTTFLEIACIFLN